MASKKKTEEVNIWEKFGPIMFAGLLVLAFIVGNLWQKVSSMEGGSTNTKQVANTNNAQQPAAANNEPTTGKLSEDEVKDIPQVSSITDSVDGEYVRGGSNPDVYIVEYSDFECPYCARFHPTVQQALDEYGDKIAWVYRHYPLDSIHPKARPAANAAECIAEQGGNDAFWEFADIVFEDQTKLNDLEAVAEDLGYNNSQFQSCLESGKYDDKIDDQMNKGLEAGVTGTPGNFIINKDGEVWFIPGAYPYNSLKSTIDEALGTS